MKHHSPPVVVTQIHHVLPLSWGGTAAAPPTMGVGLNTVEVCPNTHYATHALLNEYVHVGGIPSRTTLKAFPDFARKLAVLAWENRLPGHPTPFW